MAQHDLNGRHPFVLKARRQLIDIIPRRHGLSPHLLPRRLCSRKDTHEAVIAHLHQAQPSQVPAAVALRVTRHASPSLSHDVSTDWVAPGQASEFGEELAAADVVNPGRGHGSLECPSLRLVCARSCCLFDTAKLRQGVDLMPFQRFDQSFGGRL